MLAIALRIAAFAGVLLFLVGCTTLPNGRRWGEDATPLPGWDRVGRALIRAATDPGTWGPAAAALAMRAGDVDHRVSRWAQDHTPIFGDQESADSASTDIKSLLRAACIGSVFATPSGDEADDWALSKAKGFAVEWSAWEATMLATEGVKSAVGRRRPRGGAGSFPSSCAADDFDYATLTSRNLDCIALPSPLRTGLQVGVYGVAGLSAWARVEAGAHHPSDVLAGAALGHFLGSFVHDAFLGLPEDAGPELEIAPSRNGVTIALTISF